MPRRMITVALPDALYERVWETAKAASRSIEEILTQFITLSLPPLEDDLPPDLRSELAGISLLSDTKLWEIAKETMNEERQIQLESLADLNKHRPLTDIEQSTLAQLMNEAERVMLRKAEAYRLLARRGHTVFNSAGMFSN